MSLLDLLGEYGSSLESWEGSGELDHEHGTAPVEWAAAQYPHGQVLLACQGGAEAVDAFFTGPSAFRGETTGGVRLDCDEFFGELPILSDVLSDDAGDATAWAVYGLSLLHADLPASGGPGLVRHLLTNFEFDRAFRRSGMEFELPGVEGTVRLMPEPTDRFATERLRAQRTARPTAWLEIEPQGGQAVRARSIANSVCNLLSIARGTKISWIQEEVVNDQGEPTHRFYAHRVTKTYSPYAPLDPVRIGGTTDFLRRTYPVYAAEKDRLRLDAGTIDSVLDAKTEADFLETRGAKLAVALEALKQNVLLESDPGAAYQHPPEQFESLLEGLAECSKKVLLDGGVPAAVASSIATPVRFLGLNRRSFSNLLRRTSKKVGLRMSNADIALFVKCRNSLVHRGDFYCASATEEERATVPPKDSKHQEYLFLLSVVDAFLLRLVDYRGPYLVRLGGSEWEERTL